MKKIANQAKRDAYDLANSVTSKAAEQISTSLAFSNKKKKWSLTKTSNEEIEELAKQYYLPVLKANEGINQTKFSRFDYGAGLATPIPGSHFVTLVPPRTRKEVGEFFKHAAFGEYAVSAIAATISDVTDPNLKDSENISENTKIDTDAYPYMLGNYETDAYTVKCTLVNSDLSRITEEEQKELFTSQGDGSLVFEHPFISQVTITNKQTDEVKRLDVYVLPTEDAKPTAYNTGLYSKDADTSLLDVPLQFYKAGLCLPVAIHCRAGAGRTGTFLLQCLLDQNFNQIFGDNFFGLSDREQIKVVKAAYPKIEALTQYIRIWFPGYVDNEAQWIGAIRNAILFKEIGLPSRGLEAIYNLDSIADILEATTTTDAGMDTSSASLGSQNSSFDEEGEPISEEERVSEEKAVFSKEEEITTVLESSAVAMTFDFQGLFGDNPANQEAVLQKAKEYRNKLLLSKKSANAAPGSTEPSSADHKAPPPYKKRNKVSLFQTVGNTGKQAVVSLDFGSSMLKKIGL